MITHYLDIRNEEEFAGFSYLSNNDQLRYNGVCRNNNHDIPLHTPYELNLLDHDWVSIGSNCLCLCGVHRILMKGSQRLGNLPMCTTGINDLTIIYNCNLEVKNNQFGTCSIDKTNANTGEKVIITAIPNEENTLTSIRINNTSRALSSFTNEGENRYGYIVESDNVTIEPYFARPVIYPTYNVGTGAYINGSSRYNKYDEYSIPISTHPLYRIKTVKVNGEEVEVIDGSINGTVTGPLTIDVETEKIDYSNVKADSKSILIDFTKVKNSLELSYLQHEAIKLLNNNSIIYENGSYQTIGGCSSKSSPSVTFNTSNDCYTRYIRTNYKSVDDKNLIDINDNYSYYQRFPDFIDEPIFGPGGEMEVRASAVEPKISLPGPIYNSSDFTYFTASDGTTPEDNIYYELTPEDKEIRNYQGDLIFEKYDNIIIKFGEYNVNENKKKDIVIDYSTTDNYCASPQVFIPYLIDKGVINEEYDEETNTVKLTNEEGKVLAITDTNYYLLEVGEDITEEDNIEIEIDDEFTEAFPNISSIYNKVSLVFANTNEATPEEEKNNSIIDILVNPKTGHNILFSIIFIALLTGTTIYIKNNKKI